MAQRRTVVSIAAAVRAGDLSALELVEESIERQQRLDGTLHAFVHVDPASARAEARRRDEDVRHGRELGPLHGVPFAVKDLIDVRGWPTRAQSNAMPSVPARGDAALVARLRRAGAIPIGKLALEEFGVGDEEDEGPFPAARNPWATDRTPGGSSSGSGVAVAAGLVPLALGTDTGGSVRMPAALCGVVGFKPAWDGDALRGVLALAPTLDAVGWLTSTVADCAAVLEALRPDAPAAPSTIAGMRVGVVRHFFERDVPAASAQREALEGAFRELSRLGAELLEIEVTPAAAFELCGKTILEAEAYVLHRDRLAASESGYGRGARAALRAAGTVGRHAYLEACRERERLRRETAAVIHRARVDVLATAVAPAAAWAFGDAAARRRVGERALRMPFNVLGYPALALPVGVAGDGLPLAMQLAAPPGRDGALMALGAAYQRVTGWHRMLPPIPGTT